MSIGRGSTVGFIGTGVMGAPMAGRLIDAGYRLVVHDRTRSKAERLLERGARWADSPAEAASCADVVVTMLGYPSDVEQVYLSRDGVLRKARKGAYVVDMTTSSPLLAARIAAEAMLRGLHALDAPVSGGDVGAHEATLSIMVGGSEEDLEVVRPLLEVLGRQVVLQGRAGAGQHAKMANQIAIAGTMLGVVEAIAYAERAGCDPESVLEAISGGAASSWTPTNPAPRMVAEDCAPGYYVKHFIKDMGIALESAEEMGLELPGLALAQRLYERFAADGGADLGTRALIRLYRES